MDSQFICKQIEKARKAKGLKQKELAAKLNMDPSRYGKLERGEEKLRIFNVQILEEIAEQLDVSLFYLLYGTDDGRSLMRKYEGSVEAIELVDFNPTKRQTDILKEHLGEDKYDGMMAVYSYGELTLYLYEELTYALGEEDYDDSFIRSFKAFIFSNDILVAVNTGSVINNSEFIKVQNKKLCELVPKNEVDYKNIRDLLNPYILNCFYETDEVKKEKYEGLDRCRRATLLIDYNFDVTLLQDTCINKRYRGYGIVKFYIDVIKKHFEDNIIWANLSPVKDSEFISGVDLSNEGLVSIIQNNTSLAMKLGFTVNRFHEFYEIFHNLGSNKLISEKIAVCKEAYILPEKIQRLIKEDKNYLEIALETDRIELGNYAGLNYEITRYYEDDYEVYQLERYCPTTPKEDYDRYYYLFKNDEKILFTRNRKDKNSFAEHNYEACTGFSGFNEMKSDYVLETNFVLLGKFAKLNLRELGYEDSLYDEAEDLDDKAYTIKYLTGTSGYINLLVNKNYAKYEYVQHKYVFTDGERKDEIVFLICLKRGKKYKFIVNSFDIERCEENDAMGLWEFGKLEEYDSFEKCRKSGFVNAFKRLI